MSESINFLFGGELPDTVWGRLLVYGAAGAGKSSLGGTMPGKRLVIAADGNASLPLKSTFEEIPRVYYPEGVEDRRPTVYVEIHSWSQFVAVLRKIDDADLLAKRGIDSVIIDGVSHLGEMLEKQTLDELNRVREGKGQPKIDTLHQDGWSRVKERMNAARSRIHGWPVHVMWIGGMLDPEYTDGGALKRKGTIMLSGKQKTLFPQNCNAFIYVEREVIGDRSEVRCFTQHDQHHCKDNTGKLPFRTCADATVILAQMGLYSGDDLDEVLEAAPVITAEDEEAMKAGFEI